MSVEGLMREILAGLGKTSQEYRVQLDRFIQASGPSKNALERTQIQLDLLREMNGTPEANLDEILPLMRRNLERIERLCDEALAKSQKALDPDEKGEGS